MTKPKLIALCNGVRGLKYWNLNIALSLREIALCNGVRGLKFQFCKT